MFFAVWSPSLTMSFQHVQRTAIAESVDDDEDELEKIRERLAKVRS
jgi:hypothetical protein